MAIDMVYCGNPKASLTGDNSIHLMLENKNNKPSEVMIEKRVESKEIWNNLDHYESDYICVTGKLVKEEAVYFIDSISAVRYL